MRSFAYVLAMALLGIGAPDLAVAQSNPPAPASDPLSPICSTIEAAARANGLPVDFLVRLIWQESGFSADAVGPVTRTGERAQGIAQFMPGTAVERHLVEPFDPVEALPKSAEFLAELRDKFGNLGLAAAAYNAGPGRANEFIASSRDLPAETKRYVLAITGRPVEDWAKLAKLGTNEEAPADPDHTATCRDLAELLKQSPKLEAQQRAVPSWCMHLHHPNTNVCGAVHETELSKMLSAAKPSTRVSILINNGAMSATRRR